MSENARTDDARADDARADAATRTRPPASQVALPQRRRNFLSEVVIDFGPRETLGRLFLRADTELREKGIDLAFASLEDLIAVNRQHPDSWRPILPIFDPAVGGVTAETGFAMLGRNADGDVVTAQAARLYTLTRSTLKEEMESLRLFYADPAASREPGEALNVTAPSAATIVGRTVFVGAVWYRPDYRRQGLVNILARAVRACAFTRWYADTTFSIMAEEVVSGGTAARAGYPHVEWEVEMVNTPVKRGGVIRAALIWTTADEQLAFFEQYLAGADAQIDAVVDQRATDQQRAVRGR